MLQSRNAAGHVKRCPVSARGRWHARDHQIDQRRRRSRASSASAVEIGLRRSALRSNLENALRSAGSSMGRFTRCASARAARRTKELRVSPALRAAASMTCRSISGNETRTFRMARVYPSDIRNGMSCRLRTRSTLFRTDLLQALWSRTGSVDLSSALKVHAEV